MIDPFPQARGRAKADACLAAIEQIEPDAFDKAQQERVTAILGWSVEQVLLDSEGEGTAEYALVIIRGSLKFYWVIMSDALYATDAVSADSARALGRVLARVPAD